MLDNEIKKIINKSKNYGWILEPDAKYILSKFNIETPKFVYAQSFEEAAKFLDKLDSAVVCKIVSPEVIHKSDVGGVIVGIKSKNELKAAFDKLSKLKGFQGILVEEMVKGIELIIGAKNDEQFGPVVMVGMGGVSVEIYKDTAIRMAPLTDKDVDNMLLSLKCYPLLRGFRGSKGINLDKLKTILLGFSNMLMELEPFFQSIDLNPVICSDISCYVADARIMLK